MIEKSVYEAQKAAIIERIEAAFDGVSREDGVTLHETYVIDNYGSPEERAAARALDTESRWQDVPDNDVRYSNLVLIFLDPKGFRYYIPAFMTWYLRNMGISRGWDISRDLEWSLWLENCGEQLREHNLERFRMFDLAQSKVIAQFLLLAAQYREMYWATKWNQFDADEVIAIGIEEGRTLDEIRQDIKEERDEYLNQEITAREALNAYWGQFL